MFLPLCIRATVLNELTRASIDRTSLWAAWPPKISIHLAWHARPDEALAFPLPLYQEKGSSHILGIYAEVREIPDRS